MSAASAAIAQAASGDTESKRKAGRNKIIIGSVVAGVGAVLLAEYRTTPSLRVLKFPIQRAFE